MTKEELFAKAKEEIFGVPPKNGMEKVGYNMAINSTRHLLLKAETALQEFKKNPPLLIKLPKSLITDLKNINSLMDEPLYRRFPKPAFETFCRYLRIFCHRYEALLTPRLKEI